MAKRKKRRTQSSNQSEADKDRSFQFGLRLLDVVETSVRIIGIGGAVVIAIFCLVPLPIMLSHGEHTVIEYMVHWFWSMRVDTMGAVGAVIAAVKWAWWERRHRLKEGETYNARIVELQQYIDRTRSSSDLSVDGRTSESEQ